MAEVTGLEAELASAMTKSVQGVDSHKQEQLELTELAQLPLLGNIKIDGRKVGPGRPPGARNKSTKELAAYILQRHRHPIIAAAEVCDMPLDALAKALCCERLDAAKYQQSCREFVAKYTLQAMPQSVQVDLSTVGMLMVIDPRAPGQQGAGGAAGLTLIEQNQQLSEASPPMSHDEKSHDHE